MNGQKKRKKPSSYIQRSFYLGNRAVEEKSVVQQLIDQYEWPAVDLHKGIKKLWSEDFMDSPSTGYKTAVSTAREAMDEERGIKEYNPVLYEELQESPLFSSLFQMAPDRGHKVSVMSVDASRGYIAFPRYSENAADTQFVIQKILQNN